MRATGCPVDTNLLINVIGTFAGICSMISFIPQIRKIIADRSAEGVSLKMFFVTIVSFTLWTVYGALLSSWPIALSNAVCLILCLIIVALRFKFGDGLKQDG